ncbi:MAG: hypothetical protein ABIK44_03345 [candidate division WOR-3 bacterium]
MPKVLARPPAQTTEPKSSRSPFLRLLELRFKEELKTGMGCLGIVTVIAVAAAIAWLFIFLIIWFSQGD